MELNMPNSFEDENQGPELLQEASQLNQASMFKETLFEIPDCAICLMQLSQDFDAQWCGHVFHRECINQYFTYRPQCPICKVDLQERSLKLYFPLTKRQIVFNKPDQNGSESNRIKNSALELNYRNLKKTNKLLETNILSLQNKCETYYIEAQKSKQFQQELRRKDMQISNLYNKQTLLKNEINYFNFYMIEKKNQIDSKQKQITYLLSLNKNKQNEINALKKQINDSNQKNTLFIKNLELIFNEYSQKPLDKVIAQRQQSQSKNQKNQNQNNIQKQTEKYQEHLVISFRDLLFYQINKLKNAEQYLRELDQKDKQNQNQIKQLKKTIQTLKVREQEHKLKDYKQRIKDQEQRIKDQKQKIKDEQQKWKNIKYQQIQVSYRQTLIFCQYYRRQLQKYPQHQIISQTYQFDSDDQDKQNKQNNNQIEKENENEKVLMVKNQKQKNNQDNLNNTQIHSQQLNQCLPY